MRWFILFASAVVFFIGVILFAIREDIQEERIANSWCAAHGYLGFAERNHHFCVDPKTRQVFLPEA